MTVLMRRIFACLLISIGCSGAVAQVSASVEVNGAVRQSVTLDPAGLSAFPAEAVASFSQPKRDEPGAFSVVKGVKLRAIVEQAGPAGNGRQDWKSVVVVATASDGYRAIFTWPELSNTATGEGVLVLYERDGRPLNDREGRVALMSTMDRQIGPRYVRNLIRIEVRSLEK